MDKFQAGKFKRARPQISARASEPLTIEIINNTRGGIEGEIWERGDWGANSSPVHSFTMLDGFFYFLNCFSP